MSNNYFLKISKFLLYLVPFSAVIVYQGTLFPFIVGKYTFFRVVIELALVFFIWALAKEEIKISDIKSRLYNPLIIAVFIFVVIFILSGIFGYNPSASFWSNFERGEGGFQILHLFIFFVLLAVLFRDEKSWRRLFIISVLAAILVIAYGALGALSIENFIGQNLCLRFAGSLGNPAYTGTYLIFSLFYAAYLTTEERKLSKRWKWIGLLILFFIFLLLTQTRGALIGFGAAIFIGLLYLSFSFPAGRTRNIVLSSLLILTILGFLALIYRQSINIMPFCSAELGGGNRILDISFSTETYNTRLLLWQQSLKAFKERPILGWGPENFSAAFEKYYDPRHYNPALRLDAVNRYGNVWFDRAHNIFFDYLIFAGILGLLSFLGIFGIFYWQFIKKTLINADKKLINADNQYKSAKISINPRLQNQHQSAWQKALLFSLPIAYLVQGLVLFDVLPIYINLFLFLAFASYQFNKI